MGLSGNELLAFALVNGYSQNENGCYWGSLETTAEICGFSRATAVRVLQSLVDKGLLTKRKIVWNDELRTSYSCNRVFAVDQSLKMIPQSQNDNEGSIKMRPYNKEENKDINNLSLYKGRGFDFLQSLIDLGVSEDVAKAFLQVRKEKKATNTEVAFNGLKREIDKASVYFQKTPDDCIRICVENSWKGFKADWLNESQRQSRPAQPQRRESVMEHNMRAIDQMFGTDYHAQYYGNPQPQTPDFDEQ